MSEVGVEVENNENYKRIKVTNVPGNIRNQAFLDLCTKYGRVTGIELVRKKDNQIGFASYITTQDAQYAVYRLSGYTLQGQELNSYPAPLSAEQIKRKQEEEARKRSERETSFVKKVKTKKGPSKGSLRFLTPVNPTFENGEFVQVGVSIPARGNRKRTNNQNRQNNTNTTNTTGNQKNANQNGQGQKKTNQNKNQQKQTNGTNPTGNNQKKGNQNGQGQKKANQNKNQNKVNNATPTGNNQNKGNQNGQGQKKANQNKNQGKQTQQGGQRYRRKEETTTSESTILDSESPLTYFEVVVTNTSTNETVLKLLRRQDELDKPIILQQEIAF